MRYLKTIDGDTENLCKGYRIRNWSINDDGFIDVDGDVDFDYIQLENIPIKFSKVGGYFVCNSNKLTSLEGCPNEVGGDFNCSGNKLTSLEGCPKEVGGDFNCSGNKLTSLEGCPNEVGGDFNCSGNKLTSLEGCPKEIVGDFLCYVNRLTSLEGGPKEIGGYFDCSYNQLTIIDYLPLKIVGSIDLSYNKIKDIRVEKKSYIFSDKCYLHNNPINEEFKQWNGNLSGFIKNLNRLIKINEILENN